MSIIYICGVSIPLDVFKYFQSFYPIYFYKWSLSFFGKTDINYLDFGAFLMSFS